jgi:very-short-patch-repair endonuclease
VGASTAVRLGNICGCALCSEASIEEVHPELVGRLFDPRDAHLAVSLWVPWACPVRDPDHDPIKATAASVAAGEVYCGGCRSKDEFYAKHTPGEVLEVTRFKPSTPLEQKLCDALNELAPGLRARTRRQIVIAKEARYHRKYTIAPDLILADHVAVEVDGGNGKGYSRHDLPEGVVDDARRDRLLADVGWSVIRVRHPDGNGLRSSPATFVRTASTSAVKIAPLVLEAFTQVRPKHPVSLAATLGVLPGQ